LRKNSGASVQHLKSALFRLSGFIGVRVAITIASYEMDSFIAEGFDRIVSENRKSSNEMWAASLSTWLPKAAYLASKSLVKGQTPSWRDILYSLDCPKTFIYGERSLPDSDMNVLLDNGIHIEIVENAGHSMALENPEGLALAIKKVSCTATAFLT